MWPQACCESTNIARGEASYSSNSVVGLLYPIISYRPYNPNRYSGIVSSFFKFRPARSYTLNPNPAMQLRYWSTVDLQSCAGSAALEKSIHSSRFDFSCVHTQHGC